MAESRNLEDRLRSHADAFNSLLSLIPAKDYYVQDKSDQWKRKKQTKEQARAAKMAKLDPANYQSALDVMQENERKRKRKDEDGATNGIELERPREGMKAPKQLKKQKAGISAQTETCDGAEASKPAKKAKKKKEKNVEKKARKESRQSKKLDKKAQEQQAEDGKEDGDDVGSAGEDGGEMDMSFLATAELESSESKMKSDTAASPGPRSEPTNESKNKPTEPSKTGSLESSPASFDFSAHPSGTSSISSISTTPSNVAATPSSADSQEQKGSSSKSKPETGPHRSSSEIKESLRQLLANKRSQRNADVDGQPARSRAELIESRRRKQEQRKATKKALRQQAKEDEMRKREESLSRGSPLMSPALYSPTAGDDSNTFAFGRVAFENGLTMSADLNVAMDLAAKKKGPSDVKTALLKAQAEDARLAALDPAKRTELQEKNMWLAARKHANGERVQNSSSLLVKALKRKQKQKEKSSNEWKKRLDGVKAGKEAKQRKREENLARRKEERAKKKSKAKPKRPGFEGSFRARGKRK